MSTLPVSLKVVDTPKDGHDTHMSDNIHMWVYVRHIYVCVRLKKYICECKEYICVEECKYM